MGVCRVKYGGVVVKKETDWAKEVDLRFGLPYQIWTVDFSTFQI